MPPSIISLIPDYKLLNDKNYSDNKIQTNSDILSSPFDITSANSDIDIDNNIYQKMKTSTSNLGNFIDNNNQNKIKRILNFDYMDDINKNIDTDTDTVNGSSNILSLISCLIVIIAIIIGGYYLYTFIKAKVNVDSSDISISEQIDKSKVNVSDKSKVSVSDKSKVSASDKSKVSASDKSIVSTIDKTKAIENKS